MRHVNARQSIICAALGTLLSAPAAAQSQSSFISFRELADPSALVVLDTNIAAVDMISRDRAFVAAHWPMDDAIIAGYYSYSRPADALPLGTFLAGLYAPGTGRTVFSSFVLASVYSYGLTAQYVDSGLWTLDKTVADARAQFCDPLATCSFRGGLEADGSVQNLAGLLFPGITTFNVYVQAAAVPEPQGYALMLAGLGLLGAFERHRRREKQAMA